MCIPPSEPNSLGGKVRAPSHTLAGLLLEVTVALFQPGNDEGRLMTITRLIKCMGNCTPVAKNDFPCPPPLVVRFCMCVSVCKGFLLVLFPVPSKIGGRMHTGGLILKS